MQVRSPGANPVRGDNGGRSSSPIPVIIIAHSFPPDGVSGAARPGRFHRYLPRFGFQAHVVCARPDLANGDPTVHRVPDSRSKSRYGSKAAALAQRIALPSNDEADWVPPAVERVLDLIDSTGARVILSTSPPLGTHMVAWYARRKRDVRWIADFRDPLIGNPFRRTDWFFDWDGFAERRIFSSADAFIANTDGLEQRWRKRYPERARDFNIIWNGFAPEDRPLPAPVSDRSRRVLAHVGTFYRGRHPGGVLTSLDRLIQAGQLDPATVMFEQTGWVDPASIEPFREVVDRLDKAGCYRATSERIGKHEADERMASADFLLLADLNDAGESIQVPAKLFDYLCVERPIVAFTDRDSPTRRILERSGVEALLAFPDTPADEVDAKLLRFLEAGPRASRPNEWFWQTFDGERQTEILARILRGERSPEAAAAQGAETAARR